MSIEMNALWLLYGFIMTMLILIFNMISDTFDYKSKILLKVGNLCILSLISSTLIFNNVIYITIHSILVILCYGSHMIFNKTLSDIKIYTNLNSINKDKHISYKKANNIGWVGSVFYPNHVEFYYQDWYNTIPLGKISHVIKVNNKHNLKIEYYSNDTTKIILSDNEMKELLK